MNTPKRKERVKILFVCLGNICRSCSAQTIMQSVVDKAGRTMEFELDSAGLISYHEGEQADSRMRMHASKRGYHITHLSRPIRTSDFRHFDLILGMDDSNIDRLRELAPDLECEAKIRRMTDYCQTKVADHVPDPYYGGASGFENVLDLLEDACQGLLEEMV
jgi:protein-tyrosine phosphatase